MRILSLISIFIVLLFIHTNDVQTTSHPDWVRVHNLTMEGINSLYNFKFKDAEVKFNEIINLAPQDPRGYFFKAMIFYYRYTFMGIKTDFSKFIELSDKVIDVADEVLDKDKKNSNAMFYLGGIYGYRGIVRAQEDQMIRAVWDGKKGYSYLEDAIETDSNNNDAYLGLGLYNYFLSKIPGAFKWIIKLIGFNPSTQVGIEQMERTAEKGVYARSEAKWWLSIFYRIEEQTEKSFQYLKELSNNFPHNPFYVQQYADVLIFDVHRPDEAIPLLNRVVEIKNPEAERFITLGYNRLGHAYRFKNQFDTAIYNYIKFINSVTVDTFRQSYANYYVGLCLEMSGKRDSALIFYHRSAHLNDSKKRLKEPMTEYDIALEKTNNHFNAGYYDKGFQSAGELLKKSLSDDQRGNLIFIMANAYYEKGDYERAEEHFKKVTVMAFKEKTWIKPNAHYFLGLLYKKIGKKELARIEFNKVFEYKNYDEEKRLRSRTEYQLERL